MSTIPSRVENIKDILDNINNQTLKPNKIFLNIPYEYKRFSNQKINDEDLKKIKIENLIIRRCEDYGPGTKIMGSINEIRNFDCVILLDDDHLVIIDEAYIKFSQYPSYVEMINKYKNLIVIQTFSKWAGLAGLRIGYGVMHQDLAISLNAIQQPYTITNYAMEAAIISINDSKYLQVNVQKLIETREDFIKNLVDITSIDALPSEGNFVLCHLNKGNNTDFHKFMYDKKILIRIYSNAIMSKYVRISIGTPDDMKKVLEAIDEWDKQ